MTDKTDNETLEEQCKKQIIPEDMRCPCGARPIVKDGEKND